MRQIRLIGATLIACLAWMSAQPAFSQPAPAVIEVSLPSQSMDASLRALADKHKLQVLFSPGDVRGLIAPEIKGRYTVDAVLQKLTAGTNLGYSFNGQDTVVVRSRATEDRAGAPGGASTAGPIVGQAGSSPRDVHKAESIIVTATKREERAQDVPMSIAVIGNQEIERRGLVGMEDYLRSIPGVNQIDRGGADNAIVIRGITTSPQAENFNSGTTVATYFGETPITGAAGVGAGGIDVRPVDIERIEVLRGPQGTAYGSSSLGGTVRLIPVEPKLYEFQGKVAASYSDTARYGSDNTMLQGVLNLPIVRDLFAIRLVGYRYDDSGYYQNRLDPATIALAESRGLGSFVQGHAQDDVGRMRTDGGRVSALWQPTERLGLSVNYLTQKIEQTGAPEASTGSYQQARMPIVPIDRVRGEVGEIADTKLDLRNLVLNYDLGWSAFTTAASWVHGSSVYSRDVSGILRYPASDIPRSDFKSFTTEVRLASRMKGPLQFLGGLFYEDVDQEFRETIDWPGAPAPSPATFGTNPVSISDRTRKLDQRALFGEISYDVFDKLTATVGGRYFKYDRDERVLREGGLFGIRVGAGVNEFLASSENGNTAKAILSYKPTKDSLLYASWGQGFRLGRPDVGLPAACDTNNDGIIDGTSIPMASTRVIDSDFLDSYELGGKFTLFDRRLILDTALYHIKWDGLPIRAFTTGTCRRLYTANVGSAKSDGVEFQATFFVAKGLRIDFGAGYVKAVLSEDAPALNATAGARLPGAPRATANLSAQYDFVVSGHNAFVRADSFYAGKFYGDLLASPLTKSGGYAKVDVRAGVMIRKFSVELFVRNLTNEDAYTWRGLSNANSSFGFQLRPRTIGFQVGYTFG